MGLDFLCCARVLLVLVVYDGFALLQARAVEPCNIGHDFAREFLLFEVIEGCRCMLTLLLISFVGLLVVLTCRFGVVVTQVAATVVHKVYVHAATPIAAPLL